MNKKRGLPVMFSFLVHPSSLDQLADRERQPLNYSLKVLQ
jgi:hypothetical protein